jgi:hypothetical protein
MLRLRLWRFFRWRVQAAPAARCKVNSSSTSIAKPLNHAVLDDQRAAGKCCGVDSCPGRTKAIQAEVTQNDSGPSGGVDVDRGVTADDHVSDVARAAVDGDRRSDCNPAIVATGEAVDLGDVALLIAPWT